MTQGASPTAQDEGRSVSQLILLGLIGLLITLLAPLWLPVAFQPQKLPTLAFWLTLLFLSGFALRVCRRKVYFGVAHTVHQAFSFEAIFQGAVQLNPQLPYPSVEQAFLQRNTALSLRHIQGWFRLRTTAAFAIPTALAGVACLFAQQMVIGGLLLLSCAGVVIWRSLIFQREYRTYTPPWRFAAAMGAGVAAAIAEGLCFVEAAKILAPEAPAWQLLLLYTIILTAFELSPIPLALGVLEMAYFLMSLLPGFQVGSLLIPLGYRLWRTVPTIALLLFYLPRYKLSLVDLFRPSLPLLLMRAWQRPREAVTGRPQLSIVIPAFNEAERLPRYLPEVLRYGHAFPGGSEILVVDDGSQDGTAKYVQKLASSHPALRLLQQPHNMGKGAAVRRGVLEAKGAYVLFADADGSTPIEETAKLLNAAERGADVVIASRRAQGASQSRTALRDLMSTAFYRLTNLLAVPGVADTQCGFKLMRRDAAQQLFALLKEDGWAFDVELLYLAQKLGMLLVEVPVQWTAVAGSKVRPLSDAIKMLRALVRIRRRWTGLHTHIDSRLG